MENKKPLLFSPGAWICAIIGHRFEVSQNITQHIKEYRCSCCGEERTDTAQGLMEKLTPKFRETNEFLSNYYKRRCSRKMFQKSGVSKNVFSEASNLLSSSHSSLSQPAESFDSHG
jgi:hypothetical protein